MNCLQCTIEDIEEKEVRSKRAATEAFFLNIAVFDKFLGRGTELRISDHYTIDEPKEPNLKLAENYHTIIDSCACTQAYIVDYSPSCAIAINVDEEEPPTIPEEVELFLRENNLTLCFVEIEKLILEIFNNVSDFEVKFELDPEIENSKWVCFYITTNDEKEQVLIRYDHFTKEFVERFPEEKREFFRLAINLD